jgi:Ni/Fe-hydrogenase subunit HybB-like protein
VLTAAYTGYLFAQAKARDLWQSPLLAPHLLVQAALAGAATVLPFAGEVEAVAWIAGAAALVHLVLVAAEATTGHVTDHAALAVQELKRDRWFWVGVVLVAAALAAPWIGVAAAPLALAGLFAHEHAYVQAGQAVPLA